MIFNIVCPRCRERFQAEELVGDEQVEFAASLARTREFCKESLQERPADRKVWSNSIDAQEWDSIQAGEWTWYNGRKL
jgi:hypothetical protein